MFELVSKYKPRGDQPEAIDELVKGVEEFDLVILGQLFIPECDFILPRSGYSLIIGAVAEAADGKRIVTGH